MAALTQVKLETITRDEFEEMVRAWDTWTRIRDDIQTFLAMKSRASGTWMNDSADFLGGVGGDGINLVGIEAHDDGDWDSNTATISIDDLLNMQRRHEQNCAIVATKDEMQAARQEARSKEAREAQYKRLKAEFEGGLT